MKVNVDSLEDAMATTLSCRLEGLLLPQAYTNYLRAEEEEVRRGISFGPTARL
jgi:hypothetical protein